MRPGNAKWEARFRLVSVHESAHAIIGAAFGTAVTCVHVEPDSGETLFDLPEWLIKYLRDGPRPAATLLRGRPQRKRAEQEILVSVAGWCAERIYLGRRPPFPLWSPRARARGTDGDHALQCARLLGFRGRAAREYVESRIPDAERMLEERWALVLRLATECRRHYELRRAILAEAREVVRPPRQPRTRERRWFPATGSR